MSVGTNLRLRWEYAPGSSLFVVYTDDHATDAGRLTPALGTHVFVVKMNRSSRP